MCLPTSFVCCESLYIDFFLALSAQCVIRFACLPTCPNACVWLCACHLCPYARAYAYACVSVRTSAVRLYALACFRVCPDACVHVPLANLPSCVSSLLVGVRACDVCLCILRVAHPAHILRKCICALLQVPLRRKSFCELAR